MQHILVKLYGFIPNSLRRYLGGKSWLKRFRNIFLNKGDAYREVSSLITRTYENYNVQFKFYGSVQTVTKASKKGIESTLLRNSLKLIKTYKIHDNDCVIFDIGSNFGYLSLVWANSVCQKGKIIAFEPNKHVFNTFCKSVNKNVLNDVILPLNFAVGSENKILKLYMDNTTSNVLSEKKTESIQQIKMVTLDDYLTGNPIKKCDLIKIDVDGIEYDILQGSIETIHHFKPLFVVETNNDKRILQFFKDNDYQILDMNLKEYLHGNEMPLNVFCVPQLIKLIDF